MTRHVPPSVPGACPCGSDIPYSACCGPCHDGSRPPADAERLMRSRYAAYVLGNRDYLLATWHPDTRPAELDLDTPPVPKWLGLQVKAHLPQGENQAQVRFVARYKIGGRAFRLAETSRFQRVEGRWFYLDGDIES
ncbi:MAG: YchJ family metal-binding protein [Pseudomonadota bacterium]